MTRSVLAGRGIKEAKTGHTLGRLTMQLFYATDFVDRLENEMLPALRAGFIVLTDRYVYSAIARAEVRGLDPSWIRSLYGIALVPDVVFYLRVNSAQELVQRVLASGRRFDYWESGMDLHLGGDFYDSFIEYQSQMLKVFDRMSDEYGFQVLDASRSINRVAAVLRRAVARFISTNGLCRSGVWKMPAMSATSSSESCLLDLPKYRRDALRTSGRSASSTGVRMALAYRK